MSIKLTLKDQIESNLEGGLNKKFGMTLPVPFIENIIIDENGENITVKAAMYFNMDDFGDLNFVDFTRSLGDLNFYAMLALDRVYTPTSGSDVAVDASLTNLIKGDVDVMSQVKTFWRYTKADGFNTVAYYPGYDSDTSPNSGLPHINVYPFEKISEWQLVNTYYNNNGIPIKKISSEVNIPVGEFQIGGIDDNFLDYIEKTTTTISSRESISDVGILTFSSPLELHQDTSSDFWAQLSLKNIQDPGDPMIEFYSSLTSDLNSFVFFKNGALASPYQSIYVATGGEIIEDPIMGLDLLYHYSDKIDLAELVAFFKPLASISSDTDTQTMMDSLLTILETNDTNPELLVKINTFTESFVDKSSATSVGQFYRSVRKKLSKANTAIVKSPTAARQLVNNPTLIDLRGTSATSEYTPPTSTAINSKNYIFQDSFYIDREYGEYGGEKYMIDRGTFFFDYDSLLKEKSNLAQHIDVQKVEDLFGSEVLCKHFYLQDIEMNILNPDTESETPVLATITTEFSTTTLTEDETETSDENIPTKQMTIDVPSDDHYITNSSLAKPYLYLRNYNIINSTESAGLNTLNNGRFYKLMCFQYQHLIKDYEDISYADDYFFTVRVRLRDSSESVYIELYNLSNEILEVLQEYYDFAAEACSYNSTDDFFNQFFIEGVENYYATNPAESPWIKASLMYVYLEDLWENSYGGNQQEMLSKAQALSAEIGPEAGTLTALENMLEKYKDLMENLFPAWYETTATDRLAIQENTIYDEDDKYEYVTFVVYKLDGYPNPVLADWDGEEEVEEEEPTQAWEKTSGYVQYDFGTNYGSNYENTSRDAYKLWETMKSKSDRDLWPMAGQSYGSYTVYPAADDVFWGKASGTLFTEINTFIEDHDTGGGKKVYLTFTTPYQHPDDDKTEVRLSYLIAVHESEGLVRIRPYKCTHGNACYGAEIDYGYTHGDSDWDVEDASVYDY